MTDTTITTTNEHTTVQPLSEVCAHAQQSIEPDTQMHHSQIDVEQNSAVMLDTMKEGSCHIFEEGRDVRVDVRVEKKLDVLDKKHITAEIEENQQPSLTTTATSATTVANDPGTLEKKSRSYYQEKY